MSEQTARDELARTIRAVRKLPREQKPVIERVRDVVRSRSAARVDGHLLDLYTASAIVAVHDQLNPKNQAKLAAMPLRKMADAALSVLERAQ